MKSDNLSYSLDRWLKESDAEVNVASDPFLRRTFADIERKYGEEIVVGNKTIPGFSKSPRGKRSADPEVVAISKFYGYVAVSDEKAIKSACLLEDVECITWQEFLRRIQSGPQTDQTSLSFERE